MSKFDGVSVIIDSVQDISWDALLNHWALKCIDDANILLTSLTAFKDIKLHFTISIKPKGRKDGQNSK